MVSFTPPFQIIFRAVAKFLDSRSYVALPVALFHYSILVELSVLVVFRHFAQYSASKDTTFNIINGHLRRITNGFPNSFRIKSESAALIHLAICQEISATGYLLLDSKGTQPAQYL